MGIEIYTYADPYKMEEEDYWKSLVNVPHFCVSQTLANGLMSQYKYLRENCNITTVRNLINSLYNKWDNNETKVNQMIEVDNAINSLNIVGSHPSSIKNSLLNNTKSLSNCIRIFSELNLNPHEFSVNKINIDQKYLVEIYKIIYDNNNSYFKFDGNISNIEIDNAIKSIFRKIEENDHSKTKKRKYDENKINFNTIVFNGIHQFSPIMIKAIFEISKYKNVVLLFNYQKQYSEIYKTWLRIYNKFKRPIKFSDVDELVPNILLSNDGNYLADYIGKTIECNKIQKDNNLEKMELLEFDNLTEFANYCASVYQKALKDMNSDNNKKSPLYYMDEQFYSASTKVNDILRAYFPDQFGERHFLDYPIGHFFVATMNLWNSDENKVKIINFSDIKECLNSGILKESTSGLLINTFNQILSYIEDEDDLERIILKLNALGRGLSSKSTLGKYIGYLNVEKNDLKELINALTDLNRIIFSFYEDFTNGTDNFKKFYEKIKKFITSKVEIDKEFDKEMLEVVKQLLDRLEETNLPDKGSFIALRQTMNYYLSQDDKVNYGTKWIVRGFEQIDGDVLKIHGDKNDIFHKDGITYHFACLSDKNMFASKDERLPWPLDIEFFESIVIPSDLNHQIFLTAKSEYHNFNRYALLYGLQFNTQNVKLSYIKNENGKENDLYYVLSLLNLKPKKYNGHNVSGYIPITKYDNIDIDLTNYFKSLTNIEKIKYSICPFKFIMENIIQENAVHRDRFIIHTFLRVYVENKILYELQGYIYDEKTVKSKIMEYIDDLNNQFTIINSFEKAELSSAIRKSIVNYGIKNGKFKMLSSILMEKMKNKEELLFMKTEEDSNISFDDFVNSLTSRFVEVRKNSGCKYCATKDICLTVKK